MGKGVAPAKLRKWVYTELDANLWMYSFKKILRYKCWTQEQIKILFQKILPRCSTGWKYITMMLRIQSF